MFDGYEIECLDESKYIESSDGAINPTDECVKEQKARCGANYVKEVIYGIPGCLNNDHAHFHWTQVAKPYEMVDALAGRNPAAADMENFPWVRDGMNSNEIYLLYELILRISDPTPAEPTPGSIPPSRGRIYLRGDDWVDLAELLEEHPQAIFELIVPTSNGLGEGWLTFDTDWRKCFDYSEYAAFSDCVINGRGTWVEVMKPFEIAEAFGLAEFPWVRDGIESSEMALLYELSFLMVDADLLGWEFLERLDAWDSHALNALQKLAAHEEYFPEITSYFEQQGGLSDEQIPMLFALQHMLSREVLTPYRSDIMKVMLDTEQTTTIRRVIDLPLTGEFTLSVIMPSASGIPSFSLYSLMPENPMKAMQYLEESVVLMEEFMSIPFPYNYAFMLIAEFLAYSRSAGGYYAGNGLIYSSIDRKDTIAHETAHIYWNFPSIWITEGAALNFEAIFVNAPFPEYNYACSVADITIDNIAALEQLEDELGWVQVFESGCYRALGSLLFAELRQSLGDAAFRRGFGNLYLSLRDETYESICRGEYRSGCYLREAFADGATPEQIAIIDDVVARRYYGRE